MHHTPSALGTCTSSLCSFSHTNISLYIALPCHRTNTMGAVMRVRSALAFATHQFFTTSGFQYVHTPILSASDCEGAGEMFQVGAEALLLVYA